MSWRALRHVVTKRATSQPGSLCVGRFYSLKIIKVQSHPIRKVLSAATPDARQARKLKAREGQIPKTSKPLRILFCGSDAFSSASLRGLYEEQRRNPDLIASIDVLCRPGKPSGRSLKTIREVPIKAVAQELGLPIHERDTFTGWDLPKPQDEPINLIVAVSFGLFVPTRILRSAEYGGLNVHPSILPNFRGPAPLQHTIISGAKVCGVTLQTLDENNFDSGTILAQTSPNGLSIPFGGKCTYENLLNYITPLAAAILVQGLRDRVFVPPLIDVGWFQKSKLIHASKITSTDRYIKWREHTASTIERRYRALGRLWCDMLLDPEVKKRLVLEDLELVPIPKILGDFVARHKGQRYGSVKREEGEEGVIRFVVVSDNDDVRPRYFLIDGDAVIFLCKNGAMRVKEITVEGKGKQPSAKVFQGVKDWEEWKVYKDDYKVRAKRLKDDFSHGTASKTVDRGAGERIAHGEKEEVSRLSGKGIEEAHEMGIDDGVKEDVEGFSDEIERKVGKGIDEGANEGVEVPVKRIEEVVQGKSK